MTAKKHEKHSTRSHKTHKDHEEPVPTEARATSTPEEPDLGNKGHPGWVDAGQREAADTKAQKQLESPHAQERMVSGEFKINDQVRCDGKRCTVTAVLDDGETLSLLSLDGKHSFNAKAADVKPLKRL